MYSCSLSFFFLLSSLLCLFMGPYQIFTIQIFLHFRFIGVYVNTMNVFFFVWQNDFFIFRGCSPIHNVGWVIRILKCVQNHKLFNYLLKIPQEFVEIHWAWFKWHWCYCSFQRWILWTLNRWTKTWQNLESNRQVFTCKHVSTYSAVLANKFINQFKAGNA